MGEQVSWQVELALKPGALDNFRALTEEMVETTRGEPGVLSYERFVSKDGHDGNVQVMLPGGLQVSFGSGGGAAIAHVEPEHAQLEPVVIE